MRVFHGAKGAAFDLQNPVFWVKTVAFALIAALILPTVKFIPWQRRARKASAFMPAVADVRSVRRLIGGAGRGVYHHSAEAGLMARRDGLVNDIGQASNRYAHF